MKTNNDFEKKGILIWRKRFGRYNLLLLYIVISIVILTAFAALGYFGSGIFLLTLRGVLIGVFCGLTLTVCHLIDKTNVLVTGRLCMFYLRMKSAKSVLNCKNDDFWIFSYTHNQVSFTYIYDIRNKIIWFEQEGKTL